MDETDNKLVNEVDNAVSSTNQLGLEILTLKDLCRLLHLSRPTVNRMLYKGGLPAHKIGRQWRFVYKEIMEWLEKK